MTIEVALRHRLGDFELDASFTIARPGVSALFGPSGAGKSSIANAIAGLLRAKDGRVVVADRVLFDSRAGIFVPPRHRRIGYVFQDARLFPHMSVENNLRFGWRRAEARADAQAFAQIVHLLGLDALLARKPRGLSGGEKSRVALGRALLSSPNLLILDEPLAALDAARKAEILPWLERLRDHAGLPMIYVTHALDEVARLADNLLVVRDGRIAAQGAVFDLLPDIEFASLAGTAPVGAVFAATVCAHHKNDGLTALVFAGGTFFVPRLEQPVGRTVRVRLRAEDVMLAREQPVGISANNVLAARVVAAKATDDAHADVQLACGGIKIVSRITRASLARLDIQPGLQLFAVVKAVTVDSR
ncbi:MAG: molybdenum ABC transporter ATP-binding protein [Rhizomicrobium sp.]